MIKAIGTAARRELERHLDSKVHLDLSVRVRRHWRADDALLDRLGHRVAVGLRGTCAACASTPRLRRWSSPASRSSSRWAARATRRSSCRATAWAHKQLVERRHRRRRSGTARSRRRTSAAPCRAGRAGRQGPPGQLGLGRGRRWASRRATRSWRALRSRWARPRSTSLRLSVAAGTAGYVGVERPRHGDGARAGSSSTPRPSSSTAPPRAATCRARIALVGTEVRQIGNYVNANIEAQRRVRARRRERRRRGRSRHVRRAAPLLVDGAGDHVSPRQPHGLGHLGLSARALTTATTGRSARRRDAYSAAHDRTRVRHPPHRRRHRLGERRRGAARARLRGLDPARDARARPAVPPPADHEGLPPAPRGSRVDADPSGGVVRRARRRGAHARGRHGHRPRGPPGEDRARARRVRQGARRDGLRRAPLAGRGRPARRDPLPAGAAERRQAARRPRGRRAGRDRRRVVHRDRGRRVAHRPGQAVHDRHAGGAAARARLRACRRAVRARPADVARHRDRRGRRRQRVRRRGRGRAG